MAQDGSQDVEWRGQSFPYLLHHPKDSAGPSYRAAQTPREGAPPAPSDEAPRGTAHGVWDGPAPRGSGRGPTHASDAPGAGGVRVAAAAATAQQPRYVPLPGGGRLPLLGLGTYKATDPAAIVRAIDLGYSSIDCAEHYGNEAVVGQALEEAIAKHGRETLFVTSKVWNDKHRPELAKESVRGSVRDLRVGYLDLALMHWPDAIKPGTESEPDDVPILDTWRALEELVDEGLVRRIGVSNFSLVQLEELASQARIKPVVNQIELQPFLSQRKLVGGANRLGIRSVAYAPIARGKVAEDEVLRGVAAEISATLGRPITATQVALRWNVQRGVPVIPKAGSEKHLLENADIFSFELTWEHKARIDALDRRQRFTSSPPWHTWEDPDEGGAPRPGQRAV